MSTRDNLAGIQILRAIAALMVVVNHDLRETHAPDWLTTLGAAGVDIFFVISGFIMIWVAFPDGKLAETPASFFVKRLSRIVPLYWLCCGLTLLMWSLGLYRHLDPSPHMIVRSLLFLPTDERIVIVSWTLVFEMYFYALFALSLFFRSRAATILGVGGAIVAMLILGRFVPDRETADYLTRPVALEFVAGMGLAYGLQRWPRLGDFTRHLWILGFAGMIAAQFYLRPYYVQHWARIWGWGIPSLFIVASVLSYLTPRNALDRAGVKLGDASYALYLTHPFVMISYAWVLHHAPAVAAMPQTGFILVVAAAAIALGLVTHLWVEKPLVRMARRLMRSARPPAPDPLLAPGVEKGFGS